LAELRSRLDRPISVPTLALCGADDIRAKPMKGQSKYFSGPYRFEIVPDCGHFLHREKPATITQLVCDWLAGG
jgi:pimeloyl-ACP methyl ester carboxylesterase